MPRVVDSNLVETDRFALTSTVGTGGSDGTGGLASTVSVVFFRAKLKENLFLPGSSSVCFLFAGPGPEIEEDRLATFFTAVVRRFLSAVER
ncbi:hypothetical protein A0J61_09373 [Choanephora cucurbitarum]|uniref:Uncharacterized protein n=1 Tax=Choanephora cucurbitarum TaxID=101091 RepID=A0A1C7N0G5_9FUNG|nr:hypothetical protein A0J61_09373 [Choanephora cucurbitarum]